MPLTTEDKAQTWIIIPTYNEGRVVRAVVKEVLAEGYQVIVVDDGSSDQTPSILADLKVHFLRHSLNLGQGAALSTGMRYAQQLGAAYVVHLDADGQHPIHQIPDLLQPLIRDEADISMGSRFLDKSSKAAVPFKRRFLLHLGRLVNFLMTGLWMSDAHNGFRALNADALEKIQLQQPRMAHATEILQEIKHYQLRWVEIPVYIRYTAYSQAKGNTLWDGFSILAELFIKKMN